MTNINDASSWRITLESSITLLVLSIILLESIYCSSFTYNHHLRLLKIYIKGHRSVDDNEKKFYNIYKNRRKEELRKTDRQTDWTFSVADKEKEIGEGSFKKILKQKLKKLQKIEVYQTGPLSGQVWVLQHRSQHLLKGSAIFWN